MDFADINTVRLVLSLSTVLLFGLLWLGLVTFLRLKKRRGPEYLLFFTAFYVYIIQVLDRTLLEFQSLLILKRFFPNLILEGQTAGQEVNLIPLVALTGADVKTTLLNILLLVPFGLGLPLITNLRMRQVVAVGAIFSLSIELLQLITGSAAGMTFRIADINDVIFNTAGVAIGYGLFVVTVGIARALANRGGSSANLIVQYVAERPQTDRQRQSR